MGPQGVGEPFPCILWPAYTPYAACHLLAPGGKNTYLVTLLQTVHLLPLTKSTKHSIEHGVWIWTSTFYLKHNRGFPGVSHTSRWLYLRQTITCVPGMCFRRTAVFPSISNEPVTFSLSPYHYLRVSYHPLSYTSKLLSQWISLSLLSLHLCSHTGAFKVIFQNVPLMPLHDSNSLTSHCS